MVRRAFHWTSRTITRIVRLSRGSLGREVLPSKLQRECAERQVHASR